jgi:hypothetical protein
VPDDQRRAGAAQSPGLFEQDGVDEGDGED